MNEYLEFAKGLALEAGDIMLKYFKPDVEHHYKADKTIVTIADKEINQMVIDKVGQKYPSHSVLGEEGSNNKNSELAWICDPIDGTNPFSKGLPVSTFSLALAKNGVPIIGVAMDPFTSSLYSAAKGRGAHMNNQKIKVSSNDLADRSVLNVDWWPNAEIDTWLAMHQLAKKMSIYTLSIGSVVRASTMVASGKLEAAVFPGTKGKFMDIAAVKVIVEEAGGKVTNLFGDEQRYDQDIKGAIVSNGVCHERIVEAIKAIE